MLSNKITIFLLLFLVACTRTETPPPPVLDSDPEVARDMSEVTQWTLSVMQGAQIALLIASHRNDDAAPLVLKEDALLKSMMANNPDSVFGPLAKCSYLKMMHGQDMRPVCEQTVALLNERIARHPRQPIYYQAQACAYQFLDDKSNEIRVLTIERTLLPPSDTKNLARIDSRLQQLQ